MLQKVYHSKENHIKIKYANKFVQKSGIVDTTTFFYQFIYDEKDSKYTHITQ